MSLDYNIIGERLKESRTSRKLTQEKLAEKLDVSVAYLSRVECGDALINLKRLSQICEILDVSEGKILNGVSENSNNYLNEEFTKLLDKCSNKKKKLIYDIAKIIAEDA